MRNTGLIGLVLAVVITAAVADKTKVLVLKDGRRLTGQITKTPTGVQIKTRLGVLIFAKDQVDKIIDVAKPEDEYKQRLAAIDPNDAQAHLSLGRWAHTKGLLKIAEKELTKALTLDSGLVMATLLLRRVKAELSRVTTTPVTTQTAIKPNNGGGGQIPQEWLVSIEDIYRIRLAEIKLEGSDQDKSAAVIFRNNVVERFITMMQGQSEDFNARSFRGMSAFNKLKRILTETEEESIHKDILLKSDCRVMREFRGTIQRIVVSKCGSLTCHGAPKGQGQFKLLTAGARNERIDYSNFLILSQYTKGKGRMLLDRDNVNESLLLNYGLPHDDEKAKYRHPRKKKLNPPPFASVMNGNYRILQKWIGSLRGPPYGGNYDVKYKAPFGPTPKAALKLDLDGSTTRPVDK